MASFKVNGDMFGQYVKIPTDYSRQEHIYKVVGLLESNGYCDVPILAGSESQLHDEVVPVLRVIHCGVCEEKVIRVALKDCTPVSSKGASNPPCFMCNNARVDDELTEENDLSYHCVGESHENFRILIGSGDGKPMRILFEEWCGKCWVPIGVYEPKFCPNCGRELTEYRKNGEE